MIIRLYTPTNVPGWIMLSHRKKRFYHLQPILGAGYFGEENLIPSSIMGNNPGILRLFDRQFEESGFSGIFV